MSENEPISTEGVSEHVQNMPVEQMEQAIEARKPNVPESKPTIFEDDDRLTASLRKTYDRIEGKAALADEQRTIPAVKSAEPLGTESFEKSWDHIHSTKAEKTTRLEAHKAVQERIANAAKMGVTLSEQEATRMLWEEDHFQAQQEQNQAVNEWAPAAQEIQKFYPNEHPAAIAAEYARLEGRFRADPVAGAAEIANGIGMHPLQLAQQIYQRYGQQQNQPTQQDVARVQNVVEQAFAQNPRLEEIEQDVLAELQSESFKRSGDTAADLRWAVKRAEAKNRKRSTGDKIDRSMNATYSRLNRK